MNVYRYSKQIFYHSENVIRFLTNVNAFRVSCLSPNHFTTYLQIRKIHLLNDDGMTKVSISEIKRNLKTHFSGFLEGNACYIVDCHNCKDNMTNFSSFGTMTINQKTGYCYCTKCQLQGSWSNFDSFMKSAVSSSQKKGGKSNGAAFLGNFLSQYAVPQAEKVEMERVWGMAQSVESIPQPEIRKLLAKLNLENTSLKTLEKVQAKANIMTNQLVLPILTSSSKYLGLKVLAPPKDQFDDEEKQLMPVEINYPKTHHWLLGYHLVKEKEEVVLTSSVADMLTAMQNLSVPVLCTPLGISQLPQATLAYLEPFRKITLWLGNGTQGWESARVFAKKLGEKRCHFIRPMPDTPSPFMCHLAGKELPPVLRTAQPVSHKSVTHFSNLRDDVYAEVAGSNTVAGVRWRRFPVLTELLKGHRRGELTVFTGPTGAGKTTFISEYSLDLCMQNVNTLWGSFEIRNVRLAKMMLQQFNEGPLDPTPQGFATVADSFEKLPMYFLTFHGQQSVKAVLDACSHAVYVHDIAHIVIDNLQFMMGMSDSSSMDRFWKQDQIIGAFREFATLNNVHITIVIHPRKEDAEELSTSSIFGGAKASQEADNILILQDKRLTDPSSRRKYIQVAKNRYTGDLGIMPLEFHKESLSFAPRKKNKLPKKTLSSPPSSSPPVPASNSSCDPRHGPPVDYT